MDDELRRTLERIENLHIHMAREIEALRRTIGDDPDLIPLKVAAADTRFNMETVRQWLIRGVVAGRRIGGRWFVSRRALHEYLRHRHCAR